MNDRNFTNSSRTTGGTGGPALGSSVDPERASADTDALTAGAADAGAAAQGTALPNTVTNRRTGAAPAWTAEDAREGDFALIQPGWNVVSSDGEQLGTVHEKGERWFSLRYGTADERTMYIPVTFIETVANGRVVLSQPAGLLIDMKLDAPPQDLPGIQHQEVSGVAHDPRRGATAGVVVIPAPVDQRAQAPLPPGGTAATSTPVLQTPPASAVPATGGPATVLDAPGAAPTSGVQASLDGKAVSMAGAGLPGMSVNAQSTRVMAFEERSGYSVESQGESRDRPGGPTSQPGVKDHRSLEPLRTQFGETGTPGEGKERNLTDLDLVKNRHPEGSAFDSQAATVGRPLAAGEPSAARRSLPATAGGSAEAATGVPSGSVSNPRKPQD